ncbi:MAG: heme exporter protein CcmD [Rhodobacterales bacterium]|nr:MAG: heme exporter protein CcmD [Rhodobacterales bacterium]PIE12582.1 MAG: heme exporter protein CcmD [Rhodobacterales bacterium]
MPELGKYAAEVLGAWGVTLLLLALIIGATVRRSRQVRARLEEAEARRKAR